MSSGLYSSFKLPTALAETIRSTPSTLKPKMFARKLRSDGMMRLPHAVTRQKGDALPAQRAEHVRAGRIAERRGDGRLFAVGQLRHLVQAAAADDSDLNVVAHSCGITWRFPFSFSRI